MYMLVLTVSELSRLLCSSVKAREKVVNCFRVLAAVAFQCKIGLYSWRKVNESFRQSLYIYWQIYAVNTILNSS